MNNKVKVAWIGVLGTVLVALIGLASHVITKKQPITINNNIKIEKPDKQNSPSPKGGSKDHNSKTTPSTRNSSPTPDHADRETLKPPVPSRSDEVRGNTIRNLDVWKESSPMSSTGSTQKLDR